jgi:hypothetical protein
LVKIQTATVLITILCVQTAIAAPMSGFGPLILKLDGIEIFAFEGNFYTYYGEYDPAIGTRAAAFGIEMQGVRSPVIAPTDPENYGLIISANWGSEVPGVSLTYDAPYPSGAPKPPVYDQGVDQLAMVDWALSYSFNPVDPIPNPFHTTLYGTLDPLLPILLGPPAGSPGGILSFRDDLGNDGPGGIPDRLDINLTLPSDGIYHSVNLAEAPLPLLSDFLNDGSVNGNGGPGVLSLTGTVYERGFDAAGRNVWTTVVPEPGSIALFSLGVVCLGFSSRWRRRSRVLND